MRAGDKSFTKSRDKDGVLQDPRDVSSGLGSTQVQDSVMAEGSTTIENDKSVTPRELQEELGDRSLQRSASTPSLTSSWVRGSSDIGTDTSDAPDNHVARRRKVTSPSAYPTRDPLHPHHRSAATKHGSLQKGASSGLLSALLARESETGARNPSSEMALVPSNRYAMQKGPSRWLGPLTEHVLIKPLLTSGTAHIVKKIFRRPSLGIPRRDSSRSQGTSSHGLTTPRQLYRTSSQSTVRLKPPQDSQRHIFYHGTDLTNSCVSLAENLNQHAYMFTTAHGSPLIFSSLLRYNDEKAPNKRRRRRFDREYLQQITKEALVRKKANSFAYLLTQSNALDPEQEDSSSYDPYYLDDPELKTGKNRTVISLACYMGSVIQYTRPSDLKRELNEHFRSRHPTIDPSITLSKIRKVKSDLLAISEELDLEISTAAMAYAYFEKLVLKGTWKGKDGNSTSTESSPSPVTKENRKLMACVCLLLAYKVNEPKRPPGEFTALMKQMTKYMYVTAKDVKEHEFQVFSLLDFNLYLPRQEFLPHFEQILYRQDYINVQEYLGEDEFYSVAQQSRKTVE
ncbi:CDK5 and ABL1 enzyme substrate 1 [Mortierella sp. NVP85]|nr:CDK5 and ABL1 enzyme substrate 1 [Mortierella sp. NVP85]